VGGLFPVTLRVMLGWTFVLSTLAATRPLLQTFLDHSVEAAALELTNPTVNIARVTSHFYNRLMLLSTTTTQYTCVGLFVACLLSLGHLRGVGTTPGWFSNCFQMEAAVQGQTNPAASKSFVSIQTPVYDALQNAAAAFSRGTLCPVVIPEEQPNPRKRPQNTVDKQPQFPSFENTTGMEFLQTAPPVPLNLFDLFQDSEGLVSTARQDGLARKILLHGRR